MKGVLKQSLESYLKSDKVPLETQMSLSRTRVVLGNELMRHQVMQMMHDSSLQALRRPGEKKPTEEEMPTEEGMVFPPPANEPESPVYLPAFSSKVPQRWIYSPVISLEMEMSDKVLRNGRRTSEVASAEYVQ